MDTTAYSRNTEQARDYCAAPPRRIVEAGTLLEFREGAAVKSVYQHFLVLVRFDLDLVVNRFRGQWWTENNRDPEPCNFGYWLIENGFVTQLTAGSLYLGNCWLAPADQLVYESQPARSDFIAPQVRDRSLVIGTAELR